MLHRISLLGKKWHQTMTMIMKMKMTMIMNMTGGSQGGLLLMRELVRLHYGVFEEVPVHIFLCHSYLQPPSIIVLILDIFTSHTHPPPPGLPPPPQGVRVPGWPNLQGPIPDRKRDGDNGRLQSCCEALGFAVLQVVTLMNIVMMKIMVLMMVIRSLAVKPFAIKWNDKMEIIVIFT